MEFKREDRYAVFKRTDLAKLHPNLQGQFAEVVDRINKELPERRFVVVESDWPEYEAVWRVIEHRVVARGGSFILGTLKRLDAMEKYDNAGVPFRTRKAIENHVKGEGIPIVSETKTPRLAVMAVAQQVVDALEADRKDGGFDLEAGMFGPAFSNILRKWAALEYAAQPNTARATWATEAEGDAYVLGWFDGQGWGFPTPRDESTLENARAAFTALKQNTGGI